jgi:hypothetical protein
MAMCLGRQVKSTGEYGLRVARRAGAGVDVCGREWLVLMVWDGKYVCMSKRVGSSTKPFELQLLEHFFI